MGFFKNLAVKGLSAAAGGAALAITKNPALAATVSQLVNQHGHALVDPTVKALANHKFSFGSGHKLSARDVLRKVTGKKDEEKPEPQEAQNSIPMTADEERNEEGGLDVTNIKRKAIEKGKMAFHDVLSHMGRQAKDKAYSIGYEK